MRARADEFTEKTRRILADSASHRCSECRLATSGPGRDGSEPVRIGRAAHITAASPGGARYDESLTSAERASEANGIWVCANHGDIIDDDLSEYTVAQLRLIKQRHLDIVREEQRGQHLNLLAPGVSEALREWPTTIAGSWIPRPELDELAERVRATQDRVVLLLGPPGSGKSAALAKLVNLLEEEGTAVVAMRVDTLSKAVVSERDLGRWAGVSGTLVAHLRHRAASGPVAFVVDQLDQLSDLTDRDTRRLEVVLTTLLRATEIEDVRVIASCRDFDFRHDGRFIRLRAEEVTLSPLSLEAVDDVLARLPLKSAVLPKDLLGVLQMPQQLKVFVELFRPDAPLLTTYHAMLEQLWTERVGTESRRDAAARLAHEVNESEEAMVPAARLEREHQGLDELVGAGIVNRQGPAVGFTHQTLFDFARARSFAAGVTDLEDYVRHRQDALFLRPVLWNALVYLRASRSTEYARCIPRLLREPGVRLHIRTLVAEFVGHVQLPDGVELGWLIGICQEPPLRRAALRAVVDGGGWLALLGRDRVRNMMRECPQDAFPFVIAALKVRSAEVIALVRDAGWLAAPQTAPLVVALLRFIDQWDELAIGLLDDAVSAGAVDAMNLSAFLPEVAAVSPKRAIGVLRCAMEKVLATRDDSGDPRKIVRECVGFAEHALLDLRELSAADPASFLSLLPVLSQLIMLEAHAERPCRRYRGHQVLAYPTDEHLQRFFEALKVASINLASDPAAFAAVTGAFVADEADAVHAVLAHGFAALPASSAGAALSYLLGDPRRLAIAGLSVNDDDVTADVLRSLGPNLTGQDVLSLERAILDSSLVEESPGLPPDYRRELLKHELQRQSRLLRSLPDSLRSLAARQHISSFVPEERGPGLPRLIKLTPVPGPMSADEMALGADEDILHLFDELTDDTGWRHPRHWMVGGSIEAARAFKELAKRDPKRVAAILPSLHVIRHERPVGYALEGLAEAGWDATAWADLVLSLDAAGFSKPEFHLAVADAVHHRAANAHWADPRLSAMLERWLEEALPDAAVTDGATDVDDHSWGAPRTLAPDGPPQVILCGRWGGALPEGSFRVLRAIRASLLCGEPGDVTPWLATLERHLSRAARPDSIRCWRALADDLGILGRVDDRERVTAFFRHLFTQLPEVLASDGGAHLLFRLLKWWSDADMTECVRTLRIMATGYARQLAGELLSARDIVGLPIEDTVVRLGEAGEAEAVGIVAFAADSWEEPAVRRRATQVLTRGVALGGRAGTAVLGALDGRELIMDEHTNALLDVVLGARDLTDALPNALLEQLDRLLPEHPEQALRAATSTLDAVEAQRRTSTGWYEVGPALSSLAVTLQRTEGFREAGLDLFERLLRLEVSGVENVLFDLDRKPGRGSLPRHRRRRARA